VGADGDPHRVECGLRWPPLGAVRGVDQAGDEGGPPEASASVRAVVSSAGVVAREPLPPKPRSGVVVGVHIKVSGRVRGDRWTPSPLVNRAVVEDHDDDGHW